MVFRSCLALLLAGAWLASAAAAEPVSFSRDVAPVLHKRCVGCHGAAEPKGGYRLHTYEALLKPGESGDAAVVAGKADESTLYKLVSSTDADERMPREGDPLSAAQLALVKRWIDEGARFDGPAPQTPLAALIPKQPHPAAPAAYPLPLPITALAFRPDGRELAVSGYHEVTIWDPASGALLRRVGNIDERTLALEYTPDGKLLAVAGGTPGQSGEIVLVDAATGTRARTLDTLADVAFGLAIGPGDKPRLAACGADRAIRIFDLETGKREQIIEDHADWVMGIAWSPDGSQMVSASRDKTAKVFDLKTGETVATFDGHALPVYSVAFGPDGKQVYSAGADKRIHLWTAATGKTTGKAVTLGGDVYALALRGGRLFSGAADKLAREHKLDDLSEVRVFTGHADVIYALAYHAASERLATGSFDGQVRIWNAASGQPIATFQATPGK